MSASSRLPSLRGTRTPNPSGGLLWIVFAFAGTLVLNRSFARELVNDCLDALIASPASGAQLFFGKCVANYALLIAVECVCLPIFAVFYNVRLPRNLALLFVVMLLGTWGITVIGTLFSAMTVNLRLRELMLPTLSKLMPAAPAEVIVLIAPVHIVEADP